MVTKLAAILTTLMVDTRWRGDFSHSSSNIPVLSEISEETLQSSPVPEIIGYRINKTYTLSEHSKNSMLIWTFVQYEKYNSNKTVF